MGVEALCNESAWFTCCCVRSSRVKELADGMSELSKALLKLFFGAPSVDDLRYGVLLPIPGDTSRLVTGKLGILIQDERAHKCMTYMKGATGHKICGCCQNVVGFKSAWLPDPTGFCVSSASTDVASFKPHTDATVRGIQRRLAEVADVSGELKMLQMQFGYVLCPNGILADNDLDVPLMSAFCWDWMHCYFVDGVFVWEFRALMMRLQEHSLGHSTFNNYLQSWVWPRGYASSKKVCNCWHAGPADTYMHIFIYIICSLGRQAWFFVL